MRVRKKPIVVEANQWFTNGDHPQDRPPGHPKDFEGMVVRYYRHPDISGDCLCPTCTRPMHIHGWIETTEGGHTVCPGDWIITGVNGEHYPCKPDVFAKTYQEEDSKQTDSRIKPQT